MKHNTIFQDKVEQTKKGKLGVEYSKFGLFQSKNHYWDLNSNNGPKKQCSKCGVENDHFTVSCPQKRYNLNNCALNYSTCLTFYDYHLSLMYS